ncbi:TonB family protein [Rhodocaloribacter litoris]|uniref:energy transducer TonB n=1 Tax=Rhodocaloribacter litoris TaxID=2558931 RepID=UPI001421AA8A|nr:energy transducer TonB [Rhodocaloribacter litoris]QXD15027.1 TonB family protein [Rhodocaloribacter litoris]
MDDLFSHTPSLYGQRAAARRASYRLHMLIGLVFALLLVYGLTRLPLYQVPLRIGWDHIAQQYEVMLQEAREVAETRPEPGSGVPVTAFGAQEEQDTSEGEEEAPPGQEEAEEKMRTLPDVPLERMVLAVAEQMPTIRGGLGAYYINIEYPQAAIDAGIEGRLVLDFVVETDGRPSNIRVMKSLHPLCDSAAVRALRQTRFVPGRQNGELVPVRMRLPVLFRLINGRDAAQRVASKDTMRSKQ